MIVPPLPEDEVGRLAALRSYAILDTDPEQAFDDLTRVAARICGTPIALVSLIDEHRQWFKSKVGLDASETPRDLAFCAHAILEPEQVLVVGDARGDDRFRENPLVTGDPNVIFYAGAPLVTPEGQAMGTLCVIDHEPRELDEEDHETLQSLARATVAQLELRKAALELRALSEELAGSNQDLERRNAEIRRFYQGLSHELKTPLTVAKDYVSMVIEGLAGEVTDEQASFLGVSLESCNRMAAHVDDLLDLTRIETGKLCLSTSATSLGALVDSTVKGLVPQAERAGVRLFFTAEGDLPTAVVDGRRIEQVVSNLVRNAIKFTAQGGEVEVTGTSSRDVAEILVRDTGRGIASEQLDRIFERLYQCEQVDASSHQGLGLGLHLCREIVRLHGGSISVQSVVGVGTTFCVRLPLSPAGEPSPEPVVLGEVG